MSTRAHVPGPFTSRPQKDGTTFEYGDYDVVLEGCGDCGGVFSDATQHKTTEFHKAAQA